MIPQCLAHLAIQPIWVSWSLEDRNGKPVKPPLQANGSYAKADDPTTWARLAAIPGPNIGLNLWGLKGIIAFDLDDVRDPETGLPLYEWVSAMLRDCCDTYIEVSPSGRGYHIFGTTSLGEIGKPIPQPGGRGKVEIYSDTKRYITVTGNQVPESVDRLADLTDLANSLLGGPPIPADLQRRIAASAPIGHRSTSFQGVVNSCVNRGLTIERVEREMRAHPEGVANKYLEPADRLTKELERSWGKASPQGVAPSQPRPRFVLERLDQIELKPPVWLIDGLVEAGCLGLLFGDPGVGKSFVALDMALSVATGRDCLGRPVTRGPVVYIAGEGHAGLVRRSHAWAKHHGLDLAGLPFLLSRGPADLAAAVNDVRAAIDGQGITPKLIVVDTVARNFGDADENSTKDMTAFIVAVDALKAAYPDCVVLLVHHSGHTEKQRARGSMALKGALDFEYRLEDKGGKLALINSKMKDGATPDPIILELRQVDIGDMSSAVVVRDQSAVPDRPRLTPQQQLCLDAYVKAAIGSQGGVVSEEAWRAAFYEMMGEAGQDTKKRAFLNSRKALADHGIVVDGKADHPTQLRINVERSLIV